MKIGLIGDYNEDVTAHRAIPLSIKIASEKQSLRSEIQWIHSHVISEKALLDLDAIWCVPASPYQNMDNVLLAIKTAREQNIPFLGTCGGYQHAALEFARNVLGYQHADNAETNPDTDMPLIASLVCKLVEETDSIYLQADSKAMGMYQQQKIDEEYRCGFGVNRAYLPLFENSVMQFTGVDEAGDPRILEIQPHRFFVGTAFQPERSALRGEGHPVIDSFLKAAVT